MTGRFAGVGFRVEGVPTRWGNQLNGNLIMFGAIAGLIAR